LVRVVTAVTSVRFGAKTSPENELSEPILLIAVKPVVLSKSKTCQRSAALFGTLKVVTVSL